ncbi:hypothetical protein ABZP36_010639 [Zizania latifolia]
MLTDFDLSLESTTSPSLEDGEPELAGVSDEPDAAGVSCFPDHIIRFKRLRRRGAAAGPPPPRFVAEPVSARSCSFVGTHEYVAPEGLVRGVVLVAGERGRAAG